MTRRLMDVAEVAEYLGLSRARIYELARAGILPTVRVGARYRWDRQAIDAWIAGGGAATPVRSHRGRPRGTHGPEEAA